MGYTVHGTLQARILVWAAFPFSRGSSQPRDRTQVSILQVNFLPAEPQGKPRSCANDLNSLHLRFCNCIPAIEVLWSSEIMYIWCRACNRCSERIIMLEGFSAPRVADFYDNESSRFQHNEMSEAGSGQDDKICFITVLFFVNWSSHMVCMVMWNCYTVQLSMNSISWLLCKNQGRMT